LRRYRSASYASSTRGGERERAAAQRDDLAARLQALPEPGRRIRGRDPHAAERARLTASLVAADEQLNALDQHAARLGRQLGSADEIRGEHSGLQRAIGELEHQVRGVRDELAEHQVTHPPAWARDMLGERPAHPRQADQYDRAVRHVARYRIEHQLPDDTPGLGPQPPAGHQRDDWRQAADVARQVQRRPGPRDHAGPGRARRRTRTLNRPVVSPLARVESVEHDAARMSS
jgi:hypothetical protein